MAQAFDPERADRTRSILDDRIKGLSYRKLAAKYDLSLSAVHGIVKDYSEKTIKPAAEELVQLEIDRLERLLEACDAGIEAGDPKAIANAVRISESLRKLTGVDAATRVEVEHTVSAQESRLTEMLHKAAQINAKDRT